MTLRHAALAIHALSEADQRWMLERLAPPRRDAIDALLNELRELGIPPSASVLAPPGPPRSAPPAPLAQEALDDAEWLAGLPAPRILAALAGESPAVVRRLLACRDWPWADAVMSALGLPPVVATLESPRLLETFTRELTARVRVAEPGMAADVKTVQPRVRRTGMWKRWTEARS